MDGIPSTSGTLLKDRITKNYQELCNAIDCSDSFLTLLYTNDIITQGLMSKVKSIHDNTTKAAKILDFLKDCRTDADFSKFVDILRTSGYSRAVDLITEPITLPSSTTSYGYQGVVAGYIERQELQQQAVEHLKTKPNRDIRITFPIVVLHGFGGNGKSQMARRLVQILTNEVNESGNNTKCSSLWLNAVSEGSVIEGLCNFANVAKNENLSGFMKKFYQEWKDRNLLLIFDDGDDFEMLKNFLPLDDTETNVRVITTAHSEWVCSDQNVKNIPIANFTVSEFENFVAKAVSREISEKDTKQLEGHTGRIPAILSLVCKGYSQSLKRDSGYTIAKHFAKYGTEIFTFGEDGKLVPGLKESDYKKSAKAVVKQQLECMDKWEYVSPELIDLAKFILNCIAYCDPSKISEVEFFKVHPQILRKVNGDYGDIRQAIGILKEFGWVELVGEEDEDSDDDEELIYSMHACYQIGVKSQLDEQTSEAILHGMIEYVQFEWVLCNWLEKYSHLAAFWSCISSHSKRSSLLDHATETNHCFIGLTSEGLIDECTSLASAYQDQGQLVDAVLRDGTSENFSPSSPMYYLFFKATNHELLKYLILEIKAYYDHLEDSEKKVWIRHQLLHATIGVKHSQEFETFVFTLDTFDFSVNECLGKRSETLLHMACFYGASEFVQLLIQRGANVNVKNVFGQTPLHKAVWNAGIVKFLIEKGANVNEKDVDGNTPLHSALESYYPQWRQKYRLETVKVLVENGVNIHEKNERAKTALHFAIHLSNDWSGTSLLMEEEEEEEEEDNLVIAMFLVKNGANIYEVNGVAVTKPQPVFN